MGLRATVKKILETQEAYLQLRYSSFVLRTLRFARPGFSNELDKQEKLYSSLLKGKNNLVFDIGGNEGFTAEIFLRMAKSVVIVEPSERNLRILRSRFSHLKNVNIVASAASDKVGKRILFDNSSNYACSTLDEQWRSMQETKHSTFTNYEVEVVTLDWLIEKFGRPDLIKIDVEGHEGSVIKGLTKPVPLLSFEAMLPHFREQAISNIRYLTSLDGSYQFNFAVAGQLQYNEFISADRLISDVEKPGNVTIDVFCRC